MNFNDISIGELVVAITSIGIICGFLFKVFNALNQINVNAKRIDNLSNEIDKVNNKNERQKEEILSKVEQTNIAVNLLCSAISAMIDNELNDNKNKEELRKMKERLDEKKEIV